MKIKKMTTTGVLAAASFVLMAIEFGLPFMPPFLKFDFSTVPALIAGFLYGPVSGIAVILVKDLLHLLMTQTGGVGELADFICSAVMVLISSFVYVRVKNKKGAFLGLVFSCIGLMIAGGLANYFILIPFYAKVMPIEAIIEVCSKINPYISSIYTYVIFGAMPFNLIKGIILSFVTIIIYKKISLFVK